MLKDRMRVDLPARRRKGSAKGSKSQKGADRARRFLDEESFRNASMGVTQRGKREAERKISRAVSDEDPDSALVVFFVVLCFDRKSVFLFKLGQR